MLVYKRQSGIALLVFVIVIALVSATYFMVGMTVQQVDIDKREKTRKALLKAKQALLTYAMNYPEAYRPPPPVNPAQGPGNFPCPDEDFDGDSETSTFTVSPQCNSTGNGVLARLPWQELGIEAIRDGDNELLWYAVSSNFANFAGGNINTSTPGEITVKDTDGVTVLNDATALTGAVAVIIAPGQALTRGDGTVQRRGTLAEQKDPVNYLDIAYFSEPEEEDNSDYVNSTANGFIHGIVLDGVGNVVANDMVVTITYEELFDYVHPRVAGDVMDAARGHFTGCGSWPMGMPFDPTLADGEFGDDNPPGEDIVQIQGTLRVDDPMWAAGGCADGLLPPWFVAEDWHRSSYYAVNGAASCTPAIDNCLSSEGGPLGTYDKQVVMVFSGRHGLVAPTINESDYFEGQNDNTVIDSVFDANDPTPGADDYVWGISP